MSVVEKWQKVKRYNNVVFGNCIYLQYLNILHLYNREGHKHNKNNSTIINFVYQKALIRTFYTNFLTTTFVNSQRENLNSKDDLLKNWFETFVLKFSGIQK